MRKVIALVIAAMFALTLSAQEHMTFKGVAIDGSLPEFVKALESKGFIKTGIDNGTAVMSGKFVGRDATVLAMAATHSKKVYKVCVVYDGGSKWSTIETVYTDMKSMLTMKYGEPTSVVEKGSRSYGTPDYLYDLHMDQLTWESSWTTDKGLVFVRVAHDYSIGNMVVVGYEDKLNGEDTLSEYLDEL